MAGEPPAALRIVAVDEVGTVKVAEGPSDCVSKLQLASTWGEPDRQRGIERVAASDPAEPSAAGLVAVARRGGACQLLAAATGEARGDIPAAEPAAGAAEDAAAVRGLHFLRQHPRVPEGQPLLLSCTAGGCVRVHACGPEGTWAEVAAWQGPANVLTTALDAAGQRLACGCEGSQLSVWGVGEEAPKFQARGAKPNAIGLVDKPCNTAVAFLPGPGERILVGTRQAKLVLFAPAEGKRPRFVVAFREARVTALAPEASGERCWVADARGEVGLLDVAARQVTRAIKGPAGAIRALALHPSLPLLASAGLDRFLRIHHTGSRKCLAKLYLKQQLTGVAFAPPPQRRSPPDAAAAAAEAEAEAAAGDKRGPADESAAAGSPGTEAQEGAERGAAEPARKKQKRRPGKAAGKQ